MGYKFTVQGEEVKKPKETKPSAKKKLKSEKVPQSSER